MLCEYLQGRSPYPRGRTVATTKIGRMQLKKHAWALDDTNVRKTWEQRWDIRRASSFPDVLLADAVKALVAMKLMGRRKLRRAGTAIYRPADISHLDQVLGRWNRGIRDFLMITWGFLSVSPRFSWTHEVQRIMKCRSPSAGCVDVIGTIVFIC